MEEGQVVRKVIDGAVYTYDQRIDVIYQDVLSRSPVLDRTQVQRPVDLCIEVTTRCNLLCANCFAGCVPGRTATDLPLQTFEEVVERQGDRIVRLTLTGGEPLLHPHIEALLGVAAGLPECGLVLSTNGTVRPDLDAVLVDRGWLVAVSLHRREETHNQYTASQSFDVASSRIASLAGRTCTHIYAVAHRGLTKGDVDWLLSFRDEVGAAYLRFIVPRPCTRFAGPAPPDVLDHIMSRADDRAAMKAEPSLTMFVDASGGLRLPNPADVS